MTLPRQLALGISGFVVRHASPRCKEWAEAIAREVTYIDGDWAALSWALGSARILLDRRKAAKRQAPAPPLTLAEVPQEARTFVEKVRNGWLEVVPNLTWLLVIALDRSGASRWLHAMAVVIAAFGSAASCALWMVERRRLKNPVQDPIYGRTVQCAQFYRSELKRHRITMWIPHLAWCCSVTGFVVSDWHFYCANPGFLIAWFLAYVLYANMARQSWRKNQSQGERLDALLAGPT